MLGSRATHLWLRRIAILWLCIPSSTARADNEGPSGNCVSAGSATAKSSPQRDHNKNPNDNNCPQPEENATDPVEFSSGEFTYGRTDLLLPGLLEPLRIGFQYRSQRVYNGHWGFNWFFPFEQRLFPMSGATQNILWRLGTGEHQIFLKSGSSYISPAGHHVTLTKNIDGSYEIRVKNGLRYLFSSEGLLLQMIERTGATVSFFYESSGGAKIKSPIAGANGSIVAMDYRLLRIVGTLGQGVDLEYFGSTDGAKNGRLKRLVDDYGRIVDYDYDGNGNLISVTSPITSYQDENGNGVTKGRRTLFTYSFGFKLAKFGAPEDIRDHNLLSVIDDKGQTYLTNYYDDNDRVTSQEYQGGTVNIAYLTDGFYEKVYEATETSGNGVTKKYSFNGYGRLYRLDTTPIAGTQHGLPAVLTRFFEYNSCCSELTKIINPGNPLKGGVSNGISYTYDTNGNLLEERRKANISQGPDPSDLVTSYNYQLTSPLANDFNLVKSMTDPLGRTTIYFYDLEEAILGDLNGDGVTNQAVGNLVKVRYPDATLPDGTAQINVEAKFWYNSYGQKIREIQPEGNAVSYVYYPSGDPSFGLLKERIVDPGGLNLKTAYEYDAFGFLAKITDPNNNATVFVRNALSETTEIQEPLGKTTRQIFDGNGNVVKREILNLDQFGVVQNPQWIKSLFQYDAWDRLVTKTEDVTAGLTRTWAYAYDNAGNLKTITTPEGNIEQRDYDERNLMWRRRRGFGTPDEASEIWNVDVNANVVKYTNGNGKIWNSTFDSFDRLIKVVDPVGNIAETDYDKNSRVSERRLLNPGPALLTKAQFVWDELGRRSKAIALDTQGGGSNESRFFYDKNGRLVKSQTPKGLVQSYFMQASYDQANRLSTSADPLGNLRTHTYDANGNLRFLFETEKVPGQADEVYQSERKYDALNRLTELRRYDRLVPAHQPTTQFAYDSRGNLVERVDAIGKLMRYQYDLLSRRTSETMDATGLSIVTSFQYDKDDRQIGVLDADNRLTSYGYDPLDRLKTIGYAAGPGESFSYDDAGNQLTHTAQDGVVTTSTYFDNDLLKDRSASLASVVYREEFTWNAQRRPVTARELKAGVQTSLTSLSYDGFGRVGDESQDAYTVTHGYDADSNLSSLGYPSGLNVTLGYDSLDRLSSVQDGAGTVGSYTYAGFARVKTRASNLTQNNTWDGLRRLTGMQHGAVAHFAYGYDDLDRREYEQRLHESGYGDVFGYDGASRLQTASYLAPNPPAGPAGAAVATTFNLGPVEDRLSTVTNGVTTNYNAPEALHRVTSIGVVNRAYDLRGNLTDDGTRIYEYDPWNRLEKVKLKSSGTELARYEHDALGRRAKRIEGSTTSRYVYSGPRLLSEYQGSGALTLKSHLIYGGGLDETLAIDSGGSRHFVHQNALGSTMAITTAAGAVEERYAYDAFGAPTVTNGSGALIVGANGLPASSIGNPLWFSGARFDQESGHYHMRARQYEPRSGKFVSRDPLGYVNGPNPYTYVNHDPVNWIDPFGLESKKRWWDKTWDWFETTTVYHLPGEMWGQTKALSSGKAGGWSQKAFDTGNILLLVTGAGEVIAGAKALVTIGGKWVASGGGASVLVASEQLVLAISPAAAKQILVGGSLAGSGALMMSGNPNGGSGFGAEPPGSAGSPSNPENVGKGGCSGGGSPGNSAQFKKVTPSELKANSIDAEALKAEWKIGSKGDLFKDSKTGEIFIKPKNGIGPGIPTGYFLK